MSVEVNRIKAYIIEGNEAAFKEPWASIDNGMYRRWKSAAYLDVLAFIENEIEGSPE
jgi:hypothetical protein